MATALVSPLLRRAALTAALFLPIACSAADPDYGKVTLTLDGAALNGTVRMEPLLVSYKDYYGKLCPNKGAPIKGTPPAGKPVQLRFTGAFTDSKGGPAADITVQLSGYTPEELARTPLTVPLSPKRFNCPEKHLILELTTLQYQVTGATGATGQLVLEAVDLSGLTAKGRFEFSGPKAGLYGGARNGTGKITAGRFDIKR